MPGTLEAGLVARHALFSMFSMSVPFCPPLMLSCPCVHAYGFLVHVHVRCQLEFRCQWHQDPSGVGRWRVAKSLRKSKKYQVQSAKKYCTCNDVGIGGPTSNDSYTRMRATVAAVVAAVKQLKPTRCRFMSQCRLACRTTSSVESCSSLERD